MGCFPYVANYYTCQLEFESMLGENRDSESKVTFFEMGMQMPSLSMDVEPSNSWAKFGSDLLEPEFAPMLSPARYIRLLGLDAETFARNAHVSVIAITKTPGAGNIQSHLRENLRVIKAAYDVTGGDLPKALRWFRAERLPPFGQKTAEQTVAAGQVDDLIRLIDSLYAGAAG